MESLTEDFEGKVIMQSYNTSMLSLVSIQAIIPSSTSDGITQTPVRGELMALDLNLFLWPIFQRKRF